jgi:hypothetical protein
LLQGQAIWTGDIAGRAVLEQERDALGHVPTEGMGSAAHRLAGPQPIPVIAVRGAAAPFGEGDQPVLLVVAESGGGAADAIRLLRAIPVGVVREREVLIQGRAGLLLDAGQPVACTVAAAVPTCWSAS